MKLIALPLSSHIFLTSQYQYFDVFLTVHHSIDFSKYQLNTQFLYSSTICMLHYDPQHVSSSTLLILRKTDCIITASGIVTLCKQPYGMPAESGLLQQYVCYITILNMFRAAPCSSSGGQIVLLQPLVSSLSVNSCTVCRWRADCSPLSTCILYGYLQRVMIPEAVVIQLVLPMMSSMLLETCWGV